MIRLCNQTGFEGKSILSNNLPYIIDATNIFATLYLNITYDILSFTDFEIARRL